MRLYKKNGRGIQLTAAGRSLQKDVEPILFQLEKLKRKFSPSQTGQGGGFFSVGGSFSASAFSLPLLLVLFRRSHPQVCLALRSGTSHEMEQQVLKGELEIAVITNPSYSPSLVYEACWRVKLVPLASAKHPLARKGKLTLAEFAQAPLIIQEGAVGECETQHLLKELERRGLHLNVVMECASLEAVKAVVKTGAGLGLFYEDAVEQDIRSGNLKKISIRELKIETKCFIICKKETLLSSHAQELITFLRAWARKVRSLNRSLKAVQLALFSAPFGDSDTSRPML